MEFFLIIHPGTPVHTDLFAKTCWRLAASLPSIIATATAEPEVPPTLLPSPFLHGTPPTTGPEKSQPKKIQQKTAAVGRKQQEQAEASRSRQKPSEASKNQQQLPQRQQEQSSQTVQLKENNHLPQSLCDVNWGKNEVQNEVKLQLAPRSCNLGPLWGSKGPSWAQAVPIFQIQCGTAP